MRSFMQSTLSGAQYIEAIVISPCQYVLLICEDVQVFGHSYGPTADMVVPNLLGPLLYLPDEAVLSR